MRLKLSRCVQLWRAPLSAIATVLVLAFAAPIAAAALSPAHAARAAVSAEFRRVLSPYGEWRSHARWGDVWVPTGVSRDWRPYTLGRWVYTSDWGWYWASDEEDFGWIVYHYGRWVYDEDMGWCWVAGDDWGPAWVSWRRGPEYIGWAPLAPDEITVSVFDEPNYWCFVSPTEFLTPGIVSVLIPRARYASFFDRTVIVNRTLYVHRGHNRFGVNPGIEPTYIAALTHHRLHAYNVRPRVLAGVGSAPGARAVRPGERAGRLGLHAARTINPARTVPEPRRLAGENGRLGSHPPRAARRGTIERESGVNARERGRAETRALGNRDLGNRDLGNRADEAGKGGRARGAAAETRERGRALGRQGGSLIDRSARGAKVGAERNRVRGPERLGRSERSRAMSRGAERTLRGPARGAFEGRAMRGQNRTFGGPSVSGPRRSFSAPRGPSRSFAAPQGPSRSFAAPRGPSRSFAAPQGPSRSFSAPRGPSRSFAAPQGPSRSFSAPRGPSVGGFGGGRGPSAGPSFRSAPSTSGGPVATPRGGFGSGGGGSIAAPRAPAGGGAAPAARGGGAPAAAPGGGARRHP